MMQLMLLLEPLTMPTLTPTPLLVTGLQLFLGGRKLQEFQDLLLLLLLAHPKHWNADSAPMQGRETTRRTAIS